MARFLHQNLLKILFSGIVGAVIGLVVFYYWPNSYTATGSFYVTRINEPANASYFAYEGYYSQQTAQSFTNSLIAIFESVDVKSKTLTDMGIPVSEETVRKLAKNLKVKKAAPQLVTVTYKDRTPEGAQKAWTTLTHITLQTANQANTLGDQGLRITKLTTEPVIKQTFENIYVNMLVGFGLAAGLATVILSALPTKKGKA